MKNLLVSIFLIGVAFTSLANHTKGGWIYYSYLGPGTNPNTAKYTITLKIYTECILNANQWCPDVFITIFNAGNNSLFEAVNVANDNAIDIQNCTRQACHQCISDIPNICYKIATFTITKDLPITTAGYIISYQRCCRIANIINMAPGSSTVGDTWTVSIPGNGGRDPLAYQNSSAIFAQNDTAIICRSNYFTFDFSAKDPDGDSLSYAFTDAYFAGRGNAGQCNGVSDPPPFSFVSYQPPFSGVQPLGSAVTINPATGIVSGIAPGTPGTYVLTCTVTEYRKGSGIIKSSALKSLHISVADCSLTQAILEPEYFSCDSFTRSFSNKAMGGNIKTYYWEFGVTGVSNDTSNAVSPSFTYPDTGTYILKLVVNRNLPCSDSALSIVKVYPVFAADFSVQGQCKNTPIQFLDKSTTSFGFVDSWKWNFGDPNSVANTASIANPTHIYQSESNYTVSFTASNSKGCRDSLVKTILVTDKPAFTLTNDTLICNIDTLQLNVAGVGTVFWGPNYNINNQASPSPLVSPDLPTTYYATLTDPYGCKGTDSVFVDVKSFVTIQGGNDTTICQTDPIKLQLTSDALHYFWRENPTSGSMNNPNLKNPVAAPLISTRYQVTANIGKCIAQDDVFVNVVPYPRAMAGNDTTICFGTSAQLNASGGNTYFWTPSNYLTDRTIPNPVSVNPPGTIRYTVTVTDILGCPKPVSSSLLVIVQKVNASTGTGDTSVVLGQPLQLNATGGTTYLWSPARWLSGIGIANPVALPQDNIDYVVKVSNAAGCFDNATIKVKLFKVAPGFYVPTAFTPNGDGRNDYFRIKALGLKSMDAFRVFNRFGQLLFSDTHVESKGWDGTFKGSFQDPATYVWYAEGIDYTGKKIKGKGYVVLIR